MVTSIDLSSGNLIVDWEAPHDGSDALLSYLVEIANGDNTSFFVDSTDCDGSDPSVTQCSIPMSTLATTPFNLIFNEIVYVQVSAINSYGASTPSALNTIGARLRQVPDQV